GRKLVRYPASLAEIVGADGAGLFPEFAHDRFTRILAGVDASLRHLPFETGQNDLRPVALEAAADQYMACGVEQRDPHIGAVGLLFHRCQPPTRPANSFTT